MPGGIGSVRDRLAVPGGIGSVRHRFKRVRDLFAGKSYVFYGVHARNLLIVCGLEAFGQALELRME